MEKLNLNKALKNIQFAKLVSNIDFRIFALKHKFLKILNFKHLFKT